MSTFSLKPYENQIPGVRYRDGILRLRPTWAATTLDLYGAVFAVFFTAIGIWTHNIAALIVGPAVFVSTLPYLRCRVVGENQTILVVNKWRTVALAVADIDTARVGEFKPSWFLPFRGPSTLWPRALTECS